MRARILFLLAAALLVSGCGNRKLLLNVDALSFTQPASRAMAFGPVPALPVPISTGEIPVFDDLHVNMFGSASQVVDVQSVDLSFSADVADSTGSGLDTLRVYMSDANTVPTSTLPVIVLPVTLVPGQHAPLHAEIGGDPRIAALFTQDQMRVTVTTSLQGPGAGAALNGRLSITELRAAVVATHHSSL